MVRRAATWGRDTIETWEPATSVIVAPARSVIRRCASGGITRSSLPMTVQLGIDFHAGGPDAVVFARRVIGSWPAAISGRAGIDRQPDMRGAAIEPVGPWPQCGAAARPRSPI